MHCDALREGPFTEVLQFEHLIHIVEQLRSWGEFYVVLTPHVPQHTHIHTHTHTLFTQTWTVFFPPPSLLLNCWASPSLCLFLDSSTFHNRRVTADWFPHRAAALSFLCRCSPLDPKITYFLALRGACLQLPVLWKLTRSQEFQWQRYKQRFTHNLPTYATSTQTNMHRWAQWNKSF